MLPRSPHRSLHAASRRLPHCLWGGLALLAAVIAVPPATALAQSEDSSSVVTVTVMPGKTLARPGEVVPIAVILDHRNRWHTQAPAGDDPDAIVTAVTVASADNRVLLRPEAIQWPVAEEIESKAMGPATKMMVFSGRSIIYVPIEIRPDASAGPVALTLSVTYQACDDKVCLAPVTGKTFDTGFAVDPAAAPSGWTYPELFGGYRTIAASLEGVVPADAGRNSLLAFVAAGVVLVVVLGVLGAAMLRRKA